MQKDQEKEQDREQVQAPNSSCDPLWPPEAGDREGGQGAPTVHVQGRLQSLWQRTSCQGKHLNGFFPTPDPAPAPAPTWWQSLKWGEVLQTAPP